MVWADIMINGRTRLHVFANGTMTGQRYTDEVLLPHVRLFRDDVDLNLIENVWNALGSQVAGRNYPPTNKNTLIRALTEEWDKLPQQLLDNVVQSLQADWQQVVFSDESRFNLLDNDDHIHVRPYAGERCLTDCVIERHSGLTL
ncbi:transposable element Tcb2 transposase [Trichonephila clavipes]|nr:transposable element Tcb2 transposase [Trichonephila clavipes]